MQFTLNQHSSTRHSLEITVPAKDVNAVFDAVVLRIAPKVRIPGFRPGKAPKNVLLQKYGREIHQDVAEQLVKDSFWTAAQEAGAQPISQPAVDKIDLKAGADAVFRAQFDVAPHVDLPDYKKLELTKKKRIIDDAAVEEHLEGLRQRATKFLPTDEKVAEGHIATCDIKVKAVDAQGKPEKGVNYTDQVIEVQATRPFDKELIGLKTDGSKTFTIKHASDDTNAAIAGKTINYEVTIKDVRKREVPALNDEFAKDMGDYADIKALRAGVKKDLEEAAERDAVARLQTNILDTLLIAAPFEVPRSMVGLQLDDYCNEFAQMVSRQGVDPRRINWEAYRRSRLNDAERAVRSGYLLQTIGNTEDIQVSDDEIDADIRSFMDDNKIQQPFAEFKAELEQRGNTTEIKGRIRTDKIFERLLSFATIKEELLDKAAFEALVELERKRESGEAINRFDAGGLEGGELEGQEGGDPAAVKAAHGEEGHVHGPDCDHDHEPKKKTAKKASPKAEVTEAEAKPKKASKKKEDAE
jgi:trigger factor